MAFMAVEPPSDPAVVLVYGLSGLGKTTDTGYSFPNALFVASPGALESIRTTCGFKPQNVKQFKSLMEATAYIKSNNGKHKTVVFDDFSYLAQMTMQVISGGKDMSQQTWGKLKNAVLEFRNASREAGCHVILNAWEKTPKKTPEGYTVRGGPDLSGRLPEELPALCDLVVRAVYKSDAKPWPAIYRCEPSSDYVMKCRFSIANVASPCPMNLGEILRATGYRDNHKFAIERLPKVGEWQEAMVDEISDILYATPAKDRLPLTNHYYDALVTEQEIPASLARWTIRDAFDRTLIRTSLESGNSSYVKIK